MPGDLHLEFLIQFGGLFLESIRLLHNSRFGLIDRDFESFIPIITSVISYTFYCNLRSKYEVSSLFIFCGLKNLHVPFLLWISSSRSIQQR